MSVFLLHHVERVGRKRTTNAVERHDASSTLPLPPFSPMAGRSGGSPSCLLETDWRGEVYGWMHHYRGILPGLGPLSKMKCALRGAFFAALEGVLMTYSLTFLVTYRISSHAHARTKRSIFDFYRMISPRFLASFSLLPCYSSLCIRNTHYHVIAMYYIELY
jgi:hypothetical protein